MVDSVPIVDKPDPLDSQGLDLEQFSSLGGSITAATGGDGKVYVSPPQTVLSNGAQQWSNALIGNFLGKSPTLNVFQRTTNRLWGREGSVEIRFLASSVYIINLSSMRCPQVKAKEAVVLSNEQASGAPLNGLGEVSGEPLYGAGEISMGEWLYVVENVAPLDDIVETANTMEVLRCSEIVSGGVVVVGIPNVVEHSVVSSNRFDALYDVSEGQNVSLKLGRVVAGGVAELMNQ
ncbi:hypothetical protein V6N11_008271 [Hibiscus sabdariffa]|uniref:DUF4283 domain-containing protein n=1 Tax=Hibiscus sabdariffa TaxID=183260 RepID=A0ABR2Q0T2_9ROSI